MALGGGLLGKFGDLANKGADLARKGADSLSNMQQKTTEQNAQATNIQDGMTGQANGNEIPDTSGIICNEVSLESWAPIQGVAHQFPLGKEVLAINPEMDVFNEYRRRFSTYAELCASAFQEDYEREIDDLYTFLDKASAIYRGHLEPLARRAVEVLVVNEIYDVNVSAFIERHLSGHPEAMDIFKMVQDGVMEASQGPSQSYDEAFDYFRNGLSERAGIDEDSAFGALLTGLASNVFKHVAEKNELKLSDKQATLIYEGIATGPLFQCVSGTYGSVLATLIKIMYEHEKPLWVVTDEQEVKARNLFELLNDGVVPQDQIAAVLVEIFKLNPYEDEYHDYMMEKLGSTPETQQIRDYFGLSTE